MPARLLPLESDGRTMLGLVDDDEPGLKPVVIDLTRPRALARDDDLVRALGLGRGITTVVDATAGLGRDAQALAARGFVVTAVERSPLVQALWHDAIAREGLPPGLRFVAADAVAWLRALAGTDGAPDAVFLDPMYPADRPRRALPQKEMRILRAAVGDDLDVDVLFTAARAAARKRVVVKRPKKAPPLAADVAHCWVGASTRLDLHLVHP